MNCSLPGSSVHEIYQARVLEWGAIAFSECSLWRDGRDYHLSGFWWQREGQSRDDSVGRTLSIAQLCLISSLEKDGPWPQGTLWRRPAAKGLGHPLLEEARERERELRKGSQSPVPLWDRSALPTSSAWLQKVVPEAPSQGKMKCGWKKGSYFIHQTRLTSQTGLQCKAAR